MSGPGRLWTCISCLTVACGVCVVFADDTVDQNGLESLVARVRQNRRELWRTWVTPPDGRQDSAEDLRRATRRLKAVKLLAIFRPPPPPPPGPSKRSPIAATQPTRKPLPSIPADVLLKLKEAPPKGVTGPIALGDALYGGGYLKEAFVFYEEALTREQSDEDKAWILFQMANCNRQSDPPAASALYKRLLAEHPASSLGPVARVQDQLIKWYGIDKPRELLNSLAGQTDRKPG